MKTSTIHTSAMGDVLNPSSATGFRIEESPGKIVELRSETGRALLHVGHHVVTVQFIADMLTKMQRQMDAEDRCDPEGLFRGLESIQMRAAIGGRRE